LYKISRLDPVSPEIRDIEAQIDLIYKSNPLIKKNFAYSAWFCCAYSQEFHAIDALNVTGLSVYQLRYTTENVTEYLNIGLNWLYKDCPKNGNLTRQFDDEDYDFAINLFELAINYHMCSIVLTHASRGLVDLHLEGNKISCTRPTNSEPEYEAYNRMIQEKHTDKFDIQEFPITPDDISLKIHGSKFSYVYGKVSIAKLKSFFHELNQARFQLPQNWNLGKFTLKDFISFYETLFCLCVLRFNARLWALELGVHDRGFEGSIIVLDENELKKQIVMFSGLEESIVTSIIEYLTYGSNGINNPDPSLQPLIKLNEHQVAVIPSIVITSSAERNLIVLLNKLPLEREIYLRLANDKEDLMIQNLKSEVDHLNIRVEDKISVKKNLPNIDCALIDDNSKVCCIIEFKWFVEPSGVREIIEKSQELKKGVNQLLEFKNPAVNPIVQTKLNIDSTYRFYYVLVSANWIGFSDVQNPEIPIVSEKIFLEKIKASVNLNQVITWIASRSYLPQQGVHFELEDVNFQINEWSFNWYAIKPLIQDVFDPIS
jgi:hypothetical protein